MHAATVTSVKSDIGKQVGLHQQNDTKKRKPTFAKPYNTYKGDIYNLSNLKAYLFHQTDCWRVSLSCSSRWLLEVRTSTKEERYRN